MPVIRFILVNTSHPTGEISGLLQGTQAHEQTTLVANYKDCMELDRKFSQETRNVNK